MIRDSSADLDPSALQNLRISSIDGLRALSVIQLAGISFNNPFTLLSSQDEMPEVTLGRQLNLPFFASSVNYAKASLRSPSSTANDEDCDDNLCNNLSESPYTAHCTLCSASIAVCVRAGDCRGDARRL